MESIWKEVKLPEFPPLRQDIAADVLIIGGGLTGLLCAYQLSRRGIDYALIEADRICGGTTGNTTAKITSQHGLIYHKLLSRFGPEAALKFYQLHQAALGEYWELARKLDCDLEVRNNVVWNSSDPRAVLRERAALEQLEIPHRFVEEAPVPTFTGGGICFEEQAQFHPLKFAAGLAPGLRIYEHTPAVKLGKGVVWTDSHTIRAKKTIVATHFPVLNRHGLYFMKLYQQRSYVLALKTGSKPDGMYLDEGTNGVSLRTQGDLLLLGGGGHRTGKKGGGWKALEEIAKKYYPEADIAARWAAQDCMSLDGLPYIGRYSPWTGNLFVSTGFQKWGMTSAMVGAMVLTDLVEGRETPGEALFDPSRSILRPQLAVNAGETILHLLKPTRPRCPHLGCALKWNRQERSWDCPCHGSRFDETGRLLENPAQRDLNG